MTSFSHRSRTLLSRLEIEVPSPAWRARAASMGRTAIPAVQNGNLWRWEIRDQPEWEDEPLGASLSDHTPLIVAAVTPPPGVNIVPLSFENWASLAAWYEGLIRGRD